MLPRPGEVLHFSEDPALDVFVPHRAATATEPTPDVWALDSENAPSYWFPRHCPRVAAWMSHGATDADRATLAADRVHVIEDCWLDAMRTTRLSAYRFDAGAFTPLGDPPYAQVSRTSVRPLAAPERVGDLVRLHERAGIELRVVVSLWPTVDTVVGSTLRFSAIRMGNARPR